MLPLLNSNQISHSNFTSPVAGFTCNFSASWRRAGSDTSEMGRRAGELQDRMVAGLAAGFSCQGWNRRSACRLAANYLVGRYILSNGPYSTVLRGARDHSCYPGALRLVSTSHSPDERHSISRSRDVWTGEAGADVVVRERHGSSAAG